MYHMRPNCPQLKKGASERFGDGKSDRGGDKKVEPARTIGRSLQMMADEAVDAPDVVTGAFLLNGTLAKVPIVHMHHQTLFVGWVRNQNV